MRGSAVPSFRFAIRGAVLVLALTCLPRVAAAQVRADVLEGVVANESGTIVADATVTARLAGVVRGRTTTNARGEFTLTGLPPGKYEVSVERDHFEPMVLEMTVAGDGRGQSVDLASSLRIAYATVKSRLVEALERVPADRFVAPVEAVAGGTTLADVIARQADRHMARCTALTSSANAAAPRSAASRGDKARVTRLITTTIGVCDAAFAQLTDLNATETVRVGADFVTRAGALATLVADLSEAYGLALAVRGASFARP